MASWWRWCEDELVGRFSDGAQEGVQGRGGGRRRGASSERGSVPELARALEAATHAVRRCCRQGGPVADVFEAATRLQAGLATSAPAFGAAASRRRSPRRTTAETADGRLRSLVLKAVAARTAANSLLSEALLAQRADEADGLAVRRVPGMGRGLFATTPLESGRVVGDYTGTLLDAAGLASRYPDGPESADYLLRVAPGRWVDAAGSRCICRFVNHAQAPHANCALFGDEEQGLEGGSAPRTVVFAIRDIEAGEQLLMDCEYKPSTSPQTCLTRRAQQGGCACSDQRCVRLPDGPAYWEDRPDPVPPGGGAGERVGRWRRGAPAAAAARGSTRKRRRG